VAGVINVICLDSTFLAAAVFLRFHHITAFLSSTADCSVLAWLDYLFFVYATVAIFVRFSIEV